MTPFEEADGRHATMQGYEPAVRRCTRCDGVIAGVALYRAGKERVEVLCGACR